METKKEKLAREARERTEQGVKAVDDPDGRQLTVEQIAERNREASADEGPPVRAHLPEVAKSEATSDERQPAEAQAEAPALTRAEQWTALMSAWNDADRRVIAAEDARNHAETDLARFVGKGRVVIVLPNGEKRSTKYHKDGSAPTLTDPPREVKTFTPPGA